MADGILNETHLSLVAAPRGAIEPPAGFEPSFPIAYLTIQGIAEATRLDTILGRFGLVEQPSRWPNTVHLCGADCQAGSHKRQAVTLLVAALVIVRRNRSVRFYLHEVSQLHRQLARQTTGIDFPFTPDGQSANWRFGSADFSVAEASVLHLRQAGFRLPTSDGVLNLESLDLQRIWESLRRESRQHQVAA